MDLKWRPHFTVLYKAKLLALEEAHGECMTHATNKISIRWQITVVKLF
jgi:hypothetical protein